MTKQTISLLVLFTFGIIFPPSTGISLDAWVKTGGPIGGLGYDVRIDFTDKNIMFVTDNWSGVNKSTDSGEIWSSSNMGINVFSGPTGDAVPIFSLTIDPNNSDRIWAGTQGGESEYGVFRSDNTGASWVKKTNGIELEGDINLVFRGITVQKENSDIVYAQAEVPTRFDGKTFNRTKGRIYKTTDGGESWSKIWEGDNLARYLIIHPLDPDILYASTGIFDREAFNSDCANEIPGGVGVIRSTDGGDTWSQINNGIADLYVGSLRMHPTNPEILFAATGNNACSCFGDENTVSGLYKTTNGGMSWSNVIGGMGLTTVNFSPSNTDIIYAGGESGFYRSEDGGENWIVLTKPEGWGWGPPAILAGFPIDVIVDPDDPYTLYPNNYGGGIFKSTDGAETWVSWSKGYTGAEMYDIDICPTDKSLVYTIGKSGPFKSTNGGENWTGIATGEAYNIPVWFSIKQKPDDPTILLMSEEHNGILFRSTDSGNNFTEVLRHPDATENDPSKMQGFKGLAFSISNSLVVYAGVSVIRFSQNSTPAGTTIFKSTDGGATWIEKPSVVDGNSANSIVIHPTDPNTAYAGTRSGMFMTNDGADTWIQLSGIGDGDIRSIAIDLSTPSVIYAGEEGGGVWKSTNGGTSWNGPYNTGFSSGNPSIRGLVIDPTSPSTLYAGDWTSGTYQSIDGGEIWTPFPDEEMSGLSTKAILDLDISADGTVIYASTHGEGVFRYGEIPTGIGGDNRLPQKVPGIVSINQNYPNPFNPSTTVKYKIPEGYEHGIDVVIGVFNVRGQRVITLVDEVKNTGSYQVQWDGRDESGRQVGSGVYIYRLETGQYTSSRKMVISR
jgi:photosystem II stability/assembly factor-like uncharacterized protein